MLATGGLSAVPALMVFEREAVKPGADAGPLACRLDTPSILSTTRALPELLAPGLGCAPGQTARPSADTPPPAAHSPTPHPATWLLSLPPWPPFLAKTSGLTLVEIALLP